jgi:hypothetical protein
MKNILLVLLGNLIALLAHSQTYQVNQKSITHEYLMITTVTLTDTATVVKFKYDAPRNIPFGIHPPGHKLAYYITDISWDEKYYLIGYDNVAIEPYPERMSSGTALEFTLFFEKIDLKRFHLVEGDILQPNQKTKHFSNVELN